MIPMTNLERRAREFATLAHERAKQLRKYTGEPYITHPEAVVALVRSVPHTPEMLAAAWLHDVVEDCGTSLDEIERLFGYEVALLVENLTDVSKPSEGCRAIRKTIDLLHTAKASPSAKTIKLADVIDNVGSIRERDPKFAKVYLQEKALLLDVLGEGDPTLYERAKKLVIR